MNIDEARRLVQRITTTPIAYNHTIRVDIAMRNGHSLHRDITEGQMISAIDDKQLVDETVNNMLREICELETYHQRCVKREAEVQKAQRIESLARTCHEVNRIYCESLGDLSQPKWEDAPDWQKASARAGVQAHLESALTPQQSHDLWMRHKAAEGWKFGPVKDPIKKTHPCMVPFEMLPPDQQFKDSLFGVIIQSMREL